MQVPASECKVPTSSRSPRFTLSALVGRPSSALRFVGALDAFTVVDAIAQIEAVLLRKPRHVVVDFAQLERLDSSGVHALVSFYKRLKARGATVVIVDAHDQPLAVLKVLKLTKVFGL
jgi:anti-anti-sigma factor